TPNLESIRVLSFGIRAAFLVSHFPSTTTQSNSHNCLDRHRILPSFPPPRIIL
ncbi:hypothetical protein B296_00038958, partial [Ensete ventricosum]